MKIIWFGHSLLMLTGLCLQCVTHNYSAASYAFWALLYSGLLTFRAFLDDE